MASRDSPRPRSRTLAHTFSWILAGAGALHSEACIVIGSGNNGCNDTAEPQEIEIQVDPAELEAVVQDGVTAEECAWICSDWYSYEVVDSCVLDYDAAPGFGGAANGGASADEPGRLGGAAGSPTGPGGASNTAGAPAESFVTCHFNGYYICVSEGRRHASWGQRQPVCGTTAAGRWFARAAADEAGSVHSFRVLCRELHHLKQGAFRQRLRAAARDEARHARLLRREAHKRGAASPAQEFARTAQRTLLELALENAQTGCVGETYAALSMAHQARHAADPELRALFSEIAHDELRHAELAWDLHEAYLSELDTADARLLQSQLERALTALARGEVRSNPSDELGLPEAAEERRLRNALSEALRARA